MRSDLPHRSLLVLLVAAIATLNVAAQDQTPAPPPLTYELAITMTWKNLHDRILEMAKDTVFPDDKLEWKPHPDARSVLDEFRHVTIRITDRPVFDLKTVQLEDQRTIRDQSLMLRPAVRALTAEETLVPPAARFDISHRDEGLRTH